MGKKKGKQESVQLSFFDTVEPEIHTPDIQPTEAEIAEKENEEPVLTEKPETEETITVTAEEIIEEIIEEIKEEIDIENTNITPAENINPQKGKALSITEKIFDPMVIYFNADDCPTHPLKEAISCNTEQLEEDSVVTEEIGIIASAEISHINTTAYPEDETTETDLSPSVTPIAEQTVRKILITGASGFIGGFLVEEALNRGYQVWAGVRINSSRARLTDERIHFIDLAYDNLDILTAQFENFREEQGGWDYIIHNAGITKTADKMNFFKVNAENTHRFIEALNAAGCKPKKFLLMSSLSSYGAGDEKGFTPIGLEDTQRPDTAYGLSKLEAENYLRRQTYFPYVILRPTGVYGPGDRDYFVEIKSIYSGFDFAVGMTPQRITFIYVKDLARAAFLALEKEDVQNKHYFVADGDIYTDQSFARIIQDLLGKKRVVRARIPTGLVYIACLLSELAGKVLGKGMTLNTDKYKILKQRNWICDIQPLQDDLGFTPTYTLHQGLEEAIAWYKEQGWLKG